MDEIDEMLLRLHDQVQEKKEPVTESIMIKLDINMYPDGQKYIKSKAWFMGKKPITKKKKVKKTVAKEKDIQDTEQY